jgi:hypothetical protein
MEAHYRQPWVLLNNPEFKMAPGLMKVPKPIPPVVMYKQVPAPRSMAPSWDDDGSGTYRKYINKPNNPPRHHQTPSSRGLEEEQETDRTSRISSTSSFGLHSLFGSVSGSPRLLGTSHEIYSTPHNIQGGIPGQTATGIPPRSPATQGTPLTFSKTAPSYLTPKTAASGNQNKPAWLVAGSSKKSNLFGTPYQKLGSDYPVADHGQGLVENIVKKKLFETTPPHLVESIDSPLVRVRQSPDVVGAQRIINQAFNEANLRRSPVNPRMVEQAHAQASNYYLGGPSSNTRSKKKV